MGRCDGSKIKTNSQNFRAQDDENVSSGYNYEWANGQTAACCDVVRCTCGCEPPDGASGAETYSCTPLEIQNTFKGPYFKHVCVLVVLLEKLCKITLILVLGGFKMFSSFSHFEQF